MAKTADGSVRVNITLPIVVKEAMAEYAAKSQHSMSELMGEAIEEKARQSEEEELNQRLTEAYGEMSDDLQREVAEWDHVSLEAWERAHADEGQGRKPQQKGRRRHTDTTR